MVLLIANHIKWLSLFSLLILLCILAGWQLPSWTMTIKPTSFNHIARTFHFELLSGLEIHFRQTLTLILHRFHVVHKFLKARLFPCFFTITSFDNTPTLILFVFHFLGENWKKKLGFVYKNKIDLPVSAMLFFVRLYLIWLHLLF